MSSSSSAARASATRGKSGISIDETLNIARQAKRDRRARRAAGHRRRRRQYPPRRPVQAGGDVIKEATAHYMGMLATVLNGLALQDALESLELRNPPA